MNCFTEKVQFRILDRPTLHTMQSKGDILSKSTRKLGTVPDGKSAAAGVLGSNPWPVISWV